MRILSLILTLLAALVSATTASAGPKVGEMAPDFTLLGTDGAFYKLSEHVGKKGVVLAWFPKAFTPG